MTYVLISGFQRRQRAASSPIGSSFQSTRRSATGHGDFVGDEEPRCANRSFFAASSEPCSQRSNEPVAEVIAGRAFEGLDHRVDDSRVGKEIARSDGAVALGVGVPAERVRTGERCGSTVQVDRGELAVLDVRLSATSRSIASLGELPAARRSRSRGPRRGSVMFWEAAAPTPARTNRQRAPTAWLDEDTTHPTIPVSAHRPSRENVTRPPALPLGSRQRRRSRRPTRAELGP